MKKSFFYIVLLLFVSENLEAQREKIRMKLKPNMSQRNLLGCINALLSSQSHKSFKDNFVEEVHDMFWTSLRIATILNYYANPFFITKKVKVNLYHFFLAGITEITVSGKPTEISFIDSTLFNILKELDILEDFQFFLLKKLGFDRNNLGPFKIRSDGGLILDINGSSRLANKLIRLRDDNMVFDESVFYMMIYPFEQAIASHIPLSQDLELEKLNSLTPIDLRHLFLAVLEFDNPIRRFLLDRFDDLEDEVYSKLTLQTTNTDYLFNVFMFQVPLVEVINDVSDDIYSNRSLLRFLKEEFLEELFQEIQEIYLVFRSSDSTQLGKIISIQKNQEQPPTLDMEF